ncbi:MAG: response regulator, partial [Rubrivivax sp.]
CGDLQVAVPAQLVEAVRRVPASDLLRGHDTHTLPVDGESLPFYWLDALLQAGTHHASDSRGQTVVVVRSAAQRVVVQVDEVVGNQEVVVKNVGHQLSHLPGLAGVTLLPSGAVALIYNPVALVAVYADAAHARADGRRSAAATPADGESGATEIEFAIPPPLQAVATPPRAPLVMVVDDSLTVRRITQRLLLREGYRVVTAKDGLDALERLAEERPAVLLSDIEMPRMDGFDLLRNVRADPRLAGLPVVMITSRIAQKHRDHAFELGVDHYLGKPYSEDELLHWVARHVDADIPA